MPDTPCPGGYVILEDVKKNNNSVLVAMSGGIDSSVAALLMKERDYKCAGITLKLFNKAKEFNEYDDARKIAGLLEMPYYLIDFTDAFEEEVIKRFVNAYIIGHTPNPCIDCNKFIKFKKVFEKADELGYYNIATGHYANIIYDNIGGRYLLKKAADDKKDQSYVLYSLNQEQLKRIKFPLGNLTKPEIREIAEKHEFINARKKESQDICFVEKNLTGDYYDFIEKYTGISFPGGDFTDRSGNILGRHKGVIRYTIGQRRGLGLALPEPLYVCDKIIENNTVILCKEEELYTKEVTARDINLIAFDKLENKIKIKAKVRYNQKEQPAIAEQTGENSLRIEFENPQRAVTKGQSVVLYDGDIIIGGGIIA